MKTDTFKIQHDHYYRYEDLTGVLQKIAGLYPELVKLKSIGKSFEGRDIWLLSVTNFETGDDDTKPAIWVDGNIHATEVSASSACLHLIETLVNNFGTDEQVTLCLNTRALYICPRVNPDGAEWALADIPKLIRSSTRPYPYNEDPIDGFVPQDIDGDGRMLMMRIPDQNGSWKICPDNPRVLIRREPDEFGGQYFRILMEGNVENYTKPVFQLQTEKEGLDLNRNYPGNWMPEYKQEGAGPYPTSEPEIRAVVDFICKHPNICFGIAYHTFSGVLLRPFGDRPDDDYAPEDRWVYDKFGSKGTELTGYPAISSYHDFKYHAVKKQSHGVFNDWLYDQRGLFAWIVELWSPPRQAGVKDYVFNHDWRREHSLEDELTMIKWSDEVLEGKGYIDWYPFNHPQFGLVELGGWNWPYALKNPPPKLLEKEIAPFAKWVISQLMSSPKIELFDFSVENIGQNLHLLSLTVQNTGWLPTYVTKKALEKKLVRGLVCEIDLPEGATLKMGDKRAILKQMEGRSYKPAFPGAYYPSDTTEDRVNVQWVVHSVNGGTVKITAKHERAGAVVIERNI